MSEDCGEIIYALRELEQDQEVPRNVKSKLSLTISRLQTPEVMSVKLNRALHELESLGDNCNLQPMTRTSLMSVLSLIESKTQALR